MYDIFIAVAIKCKECELFEKKIGMEHGDSVE